MKTAILNRTQLTGIYSECKGRDKTFMQDFESGHEAGTILLRHDIDDDLHKAVQNAILQNELGVCATYFILNTAPYWKPDSKEMWDAIRLIQSLGHEVAWHNNIIAEMISNKLKPSELESRINDLLFQFTMNDIVVHGSASHGDPLCYEYGFVNFEIFKGMDYKRQANDRIGERKINFNPIRMDDLLLKYEAYHVPYDLYYSEPGGSWNSLGYPKPNDHPDKRIQILIHPQWHEL